MAPDPGIQTSDLKDKAQKDLLRLLEGVCKALQSSQFAECLADHF